MKKTLLPSLKAKEKIAILSLNQANFSSVLFFLLVLFLPTQLGLHFWPLWSHVYGLRIDYLAPTLYLTDLLILLLFLNWFSSRPRLPQPSPRHWLLLSLLICIFFNITASSAPFLVLSKWLKVLEFAWLAFYVYHQNLPLRRLTLPLSLAVSYTFLLAFLQFTFQKSLGGPLYWLGERSFTSSTPGIALVTWFGRAHLRPYATFPHPNALAGFALCSLLLFSFRRPRSLFESFSLVLALSLLLLSFSRSAILALLFLFLLRLIPIPSRQSLSISLLLSLLGFSLLFPFISHQILSQPYLLPESFSRRLELAVSAGQMLRLAPLFGIGLGAFIPALPASYQFTRLYLHYSPTWWLQPAHNIFLLLAAETGLVGLMLTFLVFRSALRRSSPPLLFCFLAILLTGFADHYWLTLQQTQLFFALILGFSRPKLLQ